jgi:dolichol-phosphate mannosyltransferase
VTVDTPPSDSTSPPLGSGALVVTPTYNERDNLEEFVQAVHKHAPGAHLLIVDDASPDATGDLADSLAAADPRIHVLHRTAKLGLGSAYVAGFTWGLARDYSVLLEMDADLSHDPRYLPTFFAALAQGHDVVVGSRNIPGGDVVGWGLGRHVLSKGGSLYARCVLGVSVRDLTTGYKAYQRRALEALELSTLQSNGYSFQVETTYRALERGMSVCEVPIVFVDRRVGQSKMSRRIFVEAITMMWRLRLQSLLRKL